MHDRIVGYVVVERDETGDYSTLSPDLAGCVAADGDCDECLRPMVEATRLHVEGMRGTDPEPSALAALIVPAA